MRDVSPEDHRRRIDAETDRLAATDPSQLGLAIPHIDGWTVQSVIGHTGWVLRYVSRCLAAPADEAPPRSAVGEPPPGPQVFDWFTESVGQWRAAADAVDDDTPTPTFTGPRPAAWWLRRLAHETALHRWDVESAAGTPEPIGPIEALDGVDEVLEVYVPKRMQFDLLDGSGQTMHLHATDIDDGEWMLTLHPDRVEWTAGHAKGDVAARGTASDLLLLLWSRIPPSRLQIFGEAGILDRWQAAATF